MSTRTIETPIGALTLTASADAITAVRFGAQDAWDASALLDAAEAQLREYFARTRRTFDLPLDPRGTAFELRVWAALRTIPYGETRSYGAIAAAIGSPRAARAVGMANHRNPLPILIPCHRVIGADGGIGGTYAVMPELYLAMNEHINKGEIEAARAIQYDADRIIYKMCEAHGNLYAVQKEILRRMYGLELGGVREPMPGLIPEDEPIVAEAQAMIEAAIAKL